MRITLPNGKWRKRLKIKALPPFAELHKVRAGNYKIFMIIYDPFWRTLKDRGISTYKMINKLGYSSSTLYRLRHNKGISSRLIDDLCKLLDCRVEDILEYVPDPEEPEAPGTEETP